MSITNIFRRLSQGVTSRSPYQTFTYGNRLPDRCIRIVRIKKGDENRAIECKLEVVSIDSSVEFEALSYVWGDPTQTKSILCDGRWIRITKNLYDALRQLRAADKTRMGAPIWIDAICINQQDEIEKTAQVRMMHDIYSRASRTLIWLGRQFENAHDAYDGLKRIHYLDELIESNPFVSDEELARMMYQSIHEYIETTGADAYETWMNIWGIYTREWFQRVWVIQECLLSADKNVMFFGSCLAQPSVLFRVAAALCASFRVNMTAAPFESSLDIPRPIGFSVPSFAQLFSRYTKSASFKLHELVHETFAFESTDPRDKIFALVGLASDVLPEFIDYSLDTRSVHINLAKNALAARDRGDWGFLDLLSFVRPYEGAYNPEFSLPSWAPNLTEFHDWWSGCFEPLSSLFRPLMPTETSPVPAYVAFGADESLHLRGLLIDTVSSVVRRHPHAAPTEQQVPESPREHASAIQYWESNARELARTLQGYSEAAFACTLAFVPHFGSDPSRFSDIEASYQAFRKMIHLHPRWHEAKAMLTTEGIKTPYYDSLTSELFEARDVCRDFTLRFDKYSKCRFFSTTTEGRMAWVPMKAQPGDRIVILFPSRIPYVLRETDRGYEILGDCFVQGQMTGEFAESFLEDDEEIIIY